MLKFRIVRERPVGVLYVYEHTPWSDYTDCTCHKTLEDHALYQLQVNIKRSPGCIVWLEWTDGITYWKDGEKVEAPIFDWPEELCDPDEFEFPEEIEV